MVLKVQIFKVRGSCSNHACKKFIIPPFFIFSPTFHSPDREWGGQVPLPFRRPVWLRKADHPSSMGLRGPRIAVPLPEPGGLLRPLPWHQGPQRSAFTLVGIAAARSPIPSAKSPFEVGFCFLTSKLSIPFWFWILMGSKGILDITFCYLVCGATWFEMFHIYLMLIKTWLVFALEIMQGLVGPESWTGDSDDWNKQWISSAFPPKMYLCCVRFQRHSYLKKLIPTTPGGAKLIFSAGGHL